MAEVATTAQRAAAPLGTRIGSLRDLAKFTAAVALLAILSDAAIGHALLWENDPYWTYWITKTFLIATVFGLGSAWLGLGAGRGAVITAVHTLILTVYYWSLSPVGLPSHPEWLDLQHTWVTGVPVHFGVIYLGYLVALWLWRRRGLTRADELVPSVAVESLRALAVGMAVVVVAGALESIALGEFPGLTWFVVRLLVAVPFPLVWWAAAGRDRASAIAGGLTLAFILLTYSHFLGPVGLPNSDLRVRAADPPPAEVHWLTYRDEFLVALPITVAIAVLAYLVASRSAVGRGPRLTPPMVLATVIGTLVLAGLGVIAALETEPVDERATITSVGEAMVERGPYYRGDLIPSDGELRLVAEDRNPRVTPLPPHDKVELRASVTHPDGKRFDIEANRTLVDDPLGRFGTWWGVGFDKWHHGRSGLGSSLVPATRSEVAVFAVGEIRADGELIADGVPIHVMTMDDGGVELDVGDPELPLPGLPDGHLRALWHDREGTSPEGPERARNLFGAGVLLAMLALAALGLRTDRATPD